MGPEGTPERHAAGQNHQKHTGARQQRPAGPQTREARTTDTHPRHGRWSSATPDPVSSALPDTPLLPQRSATPQGHAGPQACTLHPKSVGSGTPPHVGRATSSERESAQTGTPLNDTHSPPPPHPGALLPPPQHAVPGHNSVSCGVVDGLPHPHPPGARKRAAGPRRTPEGQTLGGGRVPRIPHPSRRHVAPPPRAPFYQTHSTQRALWGR